MSLFSGFIVLCVLTVAAALSSCSSDENRVQALISKAVNDPEQRNEQTFNELTAVILASPEQYASFLTDKGTVDIDKLQSVYDAAAKRSGGEGEWNLRAYGGALSGDLQLRLMLERSGSMTGYDSRSGSGDFKRAVSELINRFPGSHTGSDAILIVNDDLYTYPGTFETFVQDKDIFASTASLGNAAYTDFARIFTRSLTDSVPERVTVLVTDLIYSPKGAAGSGADKIFNEIGALSSSLFKSHLDKSMLIVRLTGDFRGKYYPYGDRAPFDYNGKRPYFMIITGSAAAMSRLRSADKYASFTDFSSLPGFEQEYFFNRAPLPLAWWSLMPRKNPAQGEYTLSGGSSESGAHSLKGVKAAKGSDAVILTVAADLSQIPASADYLLNKENYKVESDAPVSIESIEAVTPEMADPRNKRYLKHATHLMTLRVSGKTMPDAVTVALLNRLPDWIKQFNTADDSSPYARSFSSSTFGLQPFLEGVYNAYYGTAEIPLFTSFTIKFEN